MAVSPYLEIASDGKDLGYDKSIVDYYMSFAKVGDRRTAAFDRPTAGFYYPDKNGVLVLRALPPRTYLDVDTFTFAGKTVRNATDDASLQAALTAAGGSATPSVIVVAPGTYTGVYRPPARASASQTPGDPNIVIIIAKPIYDSMLLNGGISTVMPAKVCVSPADYPNMPYFLNMSTANAEQWAFNSGCHGYRLVGLRFGITTAATVLSRLIRFGNGDITVQTNASLCPRNLILDRCALDGHPTLNIKAGIDAHAVNQASIDCWYGDDIHHDGQDCKAFYWFNSPGPTCLLNNRFVASTENILIGGAKSQCGLPSDLECTGNFFDKPLSWNPSHPTYAGKNWSVKNLFEAKALAYALIQGNYLRHSWVDGQQGAAFLIKAESYGNGATIGYTHDVLVRWNLAEEIAFGINIAAIANIDPNPDPVKNVCSYGNLYRLGAQYFSASANPFVGALKSQNCSSIHDTFISDGSVLAISQPSNAAGFCWIDSIYEATSYGIKAASIGEGTASITAQAPGGEVRKCVLVGRPSGQYPAGNFFPANASLILYTDRAAGDFSLLGTKQGTVTPPPPPPAPVLQKIVVTPATISLAVGATQQYVATGYDQYNAVMAITPVWSVVGGAGSISSSGLFTAGSTAGSYAGAVKATVGSVSGTANVTVTAAPPPPPPPAVPTKLVVSVQPTSVASGTPFSPQPRVRVKDQYDAYINDPGLIITATVETGTETLSGGTTAVVSGDEATFQDLTSNAGATTSGTVRFSAPGLTSVVSAAFTTTYTPPPPPTPVPTSLFIEVQPTDTESGSPFTPAVKVRVKDQNGAFISDPGVTVTAVVQTGTAILTGSNTAVTVGDAAEFTGLTPNDSATSVSTLRFSAPGLGTVDSQAFQTTVAPTPPPPPPPALPVINDFTATPDNGVDIAEVLLAWDVTGADTLSINQGVGDVTGETDTTVEVIQTKTFVLTATNATGSTTASVTVTITASPPPPPPPPLPTINSFTATPTSVLDSGSVLLAWDTDDETSLSIDGGVGDVTGLTSKTVAVTATKTFTLTATNASGSTAAQVTVTVTASPPPPPPAAILQSIVVSPSSTSVRAADGQQFLATGYDQAGHVFAFSPQWSVQSGVGTISSTGLFVAGNTPGTYSGAVRAESGGVVGLADVIIKEVPPTYPPPPSPAPKAKGICGYFSRRKKL
jgi:hypothetical protein